MFILILGLAVIAMVTCIIILSKTESNGYCKFSVHGLFFVFAWISGVVALVMVTKICCITPKIATESTIDDKIAIYQEENAAIEQDIDRLVTLFPELKSDTLVQQQLEIYVANNAKIKRLREEKIDIAKLKWLLYFGK